MSVLWCVWFISRDDSPHVSFSFAEVCEMIFAHNVHCIIHFTFILVSPKLLTKQYPAFIEKRLNCRCTPPPHTHHCFLLCVHTMPTLQGLKFSFIPYFKKKKEKKKRLYSGGLFQQFSWLSHLKICLFDSFTDTFGQDLMELSTKKDAFSISKDLSTDFSVFTESGFLNIFIPKYSLHC